MNNSKKYFDFLDQIRGFAIVSVVFYHILGTVCSRSQFPWGTWLRDFSVPKSFLLLSPLSFGHVGVAIFFVVSGFCIHLSFSRKPDWLDFWNRRFFRIYPPYLAALLLFAFIIPFSWTRVGASKAGILQFLSHLLLLNNFKDFTIFGINSSFWSIAVEAQLYLLYPILLFLVKRLGWRKALLGIGVLEIGLRSLSSVMLINNTELPTALTLGLPLQYCYSWSIGAFIADAHSSGRKIPFANHSLMAWLSLAILSTFAKPSASFTFLLFAIVTATTIAKLLSDQPLPFRLPQSLAKPLSQLGILSYSIYLLHQPFLMAAPHIATRLTFLHLPPTLLLLLLCLALLPPIIALSVLWHRFIEIPSISWGKRLSLHLLPARSNQREKVEKGG
jgi:peptidoglycan/LPS O-acetylase OafA/YrhL